MNINSLYKFNSLNNFIPSKNDENHINFNHKKGAYNTVFQGLGSVKGVAKQRGMLMHITSLPAERSFCGQFDDPQTNKFIDYLVKTKQTHWIMNPLNSLEESLCPYNSEGRFSRNKFIVNLNKLTTKEYGYLLKKNELPDDIPVRSFTLEMLEKQKNPRFQIAFERFKKLDNSAPIKQEYNKFLKENDDLWLNDYAIYDSISKLYGKRWLSWDKTLQTAPENAKKSNIPLKNYTYNCLNKLNKNINKSDYENQINLFKFEQFLYDKQFNEMVNRLNDKDIHLILDLPIGVSPQGVDTWSRKKIFLLDEKFQPTKVSGCPPENVYPYTQVWGHALYDYDSPDFWNYHEQSVKQLLKTADLRLDHFVGYINRVEIPNYHKLSNGKIVHRDSVFKPKSEGGLGVDYFDDNWIQDISKKRNKNGENMFQLFVRLAEEVGKVPEDTYILENFGPLSKTKVYKDFDKQYGQYFMSQKIPISGILNSYKKYDKSNSPLEIEKNPNVAILTGNHDMPSLKEYIDILMGNADKRCSKKNRQFFDEFCKQELKLTPEERNSKDAIYENILKWFYSRNVKQVQTTLQDSLGLYWRPNIPGSWNGMEDKYLMKPSGSALLNYWSQVFPRDFLDRVCTDGINPGYKDKADCFIKIIDDMYS